MTLVCRGLGLGLGSVTAERGYGRRGHQGTVDGAQLIGLQVDAVAGRTAGIGIADALRQVMIDDGLSPAEATSRFYALGSKGLLTSDHAKTMRDFQVPYARPATEVSSWQRDPDGRICGAFPSPSPRRSREQRRPKA